MIYPTFTLYELNQYKSNALLFYVIYDTWNNFSEWPCRMYFRNCHRQANLSATILASCSRHANKARILIPYLP
uniref:Uncharacterized protein n=1 Tax=Arundo donax TaxID=35708 RepID=A0A0A9HPA4_ARUDO